MKDITKVTMKNAERVRKETSMVKKKSEDAYLRPHFFCNYSSYIRLRRVILLRSYIGFAGYIALRAVLEANITFRSIMAIFCKFLFIL